MLRARSAAIARNNLDHFGRPLLASVIALGPISTIPKNSALHHHHRTMTATASSSSRSRTRPDSVAALERLSPETLDELYRPFLHHHHHRHVAANESNGTTTTTGAGSEGEEGVVDWVDELELDAVQQMASSSRDKVKILILYGSLRTRSLSLSLSLLWSLKH